MLTSVPNHVETVDVHHHLGALKVVELLSDGRLLLRGQARPRPVGPTVVVLRVGHFHVVVESNNLSRKRAQKKSDSRVNSMYTGHGRHATCREYRSYLARLELFDRRPKAQFPEQGHLLLLALLLLLGRARPYWFKQFE